MRRLYRFLKKCPRCRKLFVLLCPSVLFGVVCEVLIPYLMAAILDRGLPSGNLYVIAKYAVFMAVTALFMTLAGFSESYCGASFTAELIRNLRDQLFCKSMECPLDNSSLMTRLTVDMDALKKAVGMISSWLKCPVMIFFTSLMTVRISSSLSWIFMAVLPVFAIVLFLIQRFSRRHYKKMFVHYDNMNSLLTENIEGIRTVKAFVREKLEKNRFRTVANQVREESWKAEVITSLNNPLLMFAVNLCILLLLYCGSRKIIGGSLQPGDLFCLITYANQILSQLLTISLMLVPVLTAQVSVKRIFEVLDFQPTVTENTAFPNLIPEDGSVNFQDVSFSYFQGRENKNSLTHIQLEIPSGSFLGITGVSGASKTTLVNLIPRFCDCTSGKIHVGGHDVREYTLQNLRSAISIVPQKSVLFSGTIAENLRFGHKNATEEEMKKACIDADAYDFVMAKPDGFSSRLEQGGRNLSGGQRQRLCIARALIQRPKILILDDSLSAVDNLTEARIIKALSDNYRGMTIIMISQRLSAIRNANRILVLDCGKIIGCANHEELINSCTIYRELYESQRRHLQ